MDRFINLFFGCPRRLLGTLAGLLLALAIISPDHFNWLMVRAFNALWPWIQIGIFGVIVVAVFRSILPRSKSSSSKKGD